MSEQPTFSLAIVTGTNAGHTVRSARKRISVGSARDNDLVLVDPGIAARHFLVLIDGPRWRIHTLTTKDVSVDRRWCHPSSGKRGAVIRAAASEIILFPGKLDQQIVAQEVAQRRNAEDADEMATSIALPALGEADLNEPTVAVNAVSLDPTDAVPVPSQDPELVEMAQMPTIAGERPPDELRQAARQMLERRRTPEPTGSGPVAPSVLRDSGQVPKVPVDPMAAAPVHGKLPAGRADERTVGLSWSPENDAPAPKATRGRSRWDRARRPPTAVPAEDSLPEVLATPESQIMPVPGAAKSVMTRRPDFGAPSKANVIPIEPDPRPKPSRGTASKNAWGDGGSRSDASSRALVPTHNPSRNSWGDSGGARTPPPKKKRAGWGDGASRSGQRPAEPSPTPPPSAPPASISRPDAPSHRIEIEHLAGRNEPALEILTHPDGEYATQIRLLGAKIDENAKSLGYRAYMVTSPEPLTGKTTAICNLAFALAEDTQRRVALVEANFRYPRFAEIFGLDERTGLISVLDGRARLNEVGHKLSDRNLVVLPAGGRHTAPAELLASPRFKALIAELVDTVDIALIDAPSVTPFADTNLVLPLVDAAFLVVAEGQTRRAWLSRALGQLGESRIIGSMFNRIPKKAQKALVKERNERVRAKS